MGVDVVITGGMRDLDLLFLDSTTSLGPRHCEQDVTSLVGFPCSDGHTNRFPTGIRIALTRFDPLSSQRRRKRPFSHSLWPHCGASFIDRFVPSVSGQNGRRRLSQSDGVESPGGHRRLVLPNPFTVDRLILCATHIIRGSPTRTSLSIYKAGRRGTSVFMYRFVAEWNSMKSLKTRMIRHTRTVCMC